MEFGEHDNGGFLTWRLFPHNLSSIQSLEDKRPRTWSCCFDSVWLFWSSWGPANKTAGLSYETLSLSLADANRTKTTSKATSVYLISRVTHWTGRLFLKLSEMCSREKQGGKLGQWLYRAINCSLHCEQVNWTGLCECLRTWKYGAKLRL